MHSWLTWQPRHLKRKVPLLDIPARGRLGEYSRNYAGLRRTQDDMDAVIDRIAREQVWHGYPPALAAAAEDEYEVTTLYF